MIVTKNFRHDLLYRVIDESIEMQVIENIVKPSFERLKKINSLGLLPEIIEMAKYSKYEHAIGAIYQINCLIDINEKEGIKKIEPKYYRPLKISAEFLHLGHFPFTYSTERALLISFIVSDLEKSQKDKEKVRKKIENSLQYLDLEDIKKSEFIERIFSLEDFKYLYRFFSVNLLLENWNKFSSKFRDGKLTDEDKKIIIGNLIDFESHGYQYLSLADRADYVQRDSLYFGTIKIDISPRQLYPKALEDIRIVTVEEQFLIHNLEYLNEVFYTTPQVISFTRLYEKIVAALILSENFDFRWLSDYDDDSFRWLICESKNKNNKKIDLPEQWIDRADKLFKKHLSFDRVFSIIGVQFSKPNTIVEIEHVLIGDDKPKIDLLSYPFDRGILVSIDYSQVELFDDTEYLPSPDDGESPSPENNTQYFDILVFQNKKQKDLSELLKIIANLSRFLSPNDYTKVREGIGNLLSKTRLHTVKNSAVLRSIAESIIKIDEIDPQNDLFLIRYIDVLSKDPEFDDLWKKSDLTIWKEMILSKLKSYVENSHFDKNEAYIRIFRDILNLPIKLLQSETSNVFQNKICEVLIQKLNDQSEKEKWGDIFEALCLIEKIKQPEGIFQMFISGHTVVDPANKSKTDKNEYDILELRLTETDNAELWIYCCSISKGIEGNNKKQLTTLYDAIRKDYPELTIRTKFFIPENRSKKKWTPKMIESGMNSN